MKDAIDKLRAALDRWETAKANGYGAVTAGQAASVLIVPALREAERLRARVAELEQEREYACQSPPDHCGCPGCQAADEAAKRGGL